MRTLWIRRFFLACVLLLSFGMLSALQPARVQADAATVSIVQPMVQGKAIGHVGTKVSLQGSNFTPGGIVRLYTTLSADPGQCRSGNSNLNVFSTNPTTTVKADGSFAVGDNTLVTWPSNAANAGQMYYICAIEQNKGGTALSSNTFTVANQVTINVSPTSVAAGSEFVVTGSNWFPPQPITVNVYAGNNEQAPLLSDTTHNANSDGTINITLTVPATAQAQSYSVHVFAQAQNEVNLTFTQNNVLTVTQTTPTPQPAPSPTPQPTPTAAPSPTPAPTPTPTPADSGGGTPSMGTILLFAIGGLGILLVIVGIILFVLYSRGQ